MLSLVISIECENQTNMKEYCMYLYTVVITVQ